MFDPAIRSAVKGTGGHQFRSTGMIVLILVAALGANAIWTKTAAAQSATSSTKSTTSDSKVELDEIVVTARKRVENLRDVPASITAISESVIQDAHLVQLDDIGALVSNLNIFEAHDNTPAVTLRGIGAFEVVQGVGFYANDVQLFEGQTVRPVDVARIEVLKGPQGTLYGGANIGGAIKYITKDPTRDWENEATLELGQYQTWNVSGVISGPLTDNLAMRISAYDDNHKGYIYDTYHQTDFGKGVDHGGRLTFLYTPQDATKVRLSFNADDYQSQNQNLLYRVLTDLEVTTPYTADQYRYSIDDYFVPSYTRKTFSSTLQIDQEISDDMALTATTAQFWSFNRGETDFAKKPIPIDQLFQDQDHRVYSQEIRLASTGNSNLDWLIGTFVQYHAIQISNSDINYNGDPLNPLVVGGDYDRDDKIQREFALFGDTTYHMGNWQFEFGLRGEYYNSYETAFNNLVPPGTSPQLAPGSLTGHQFSPRVSVQYKVTPRTNVYGTVTRGFEPADEVEQSFKVQSIRPEIATSYELGVKSALPHGAQFTAALFFINYKDRFYTEQRLDPVLNIVEIETNIGPSRNYGGEMDIAIPLTQQFKLSGGLGVTKAIWGNAQYADPQLSAAANLAHPEDNGNLIVYRNLNGLTAPFTPEYSANLALDWLRELGNGYKVGARIDGSAIGQSYWDPNDFARQKPYQLLNLGAHIERDRWNFSAHVSNVTGTEFNTIYWDGNDVGAPHSIGRINRPRTFIASGTVKF